MSPKDEKNQDDSLQLDKLDWLLLAFCGVFLVFCIWPVLFDHVIWLVDVRNWSRMGWFVVNLVVIVVLFFLIARRDR